MGREGRALLGLEAWLTWASRSSQRFSCRKAAFEVYGEQSSGRQCPAVVLARCRVYFLLSRPVTSLSLVALLVLLPSSSQWSIGQHLSACLSSSPQEAGFAAFILHPVSTLFCLCSGRDPTQGQCVLIELGLKSSVHFMGNSI